MTYTFEIQQIPAIYRNMYRSTENLNYGECLLTSPEYPVHGEVVAVYRWSDSKK